MQALSFLRILILEMFLIAHIRAAKKLAFNLAKELVRGITRRARFLINHVNLARESCCRPIHPFYSDVEW